MARDSQHGRCGSPRLDGAKERGVSTFRNLNDACFVAALAIEILMQLEPQLADVNADRAVLDDTVILGLAEDGAADAVFTQVLGLAVQSSLSQEVQQISEPGRLLDGRTGGDPFDQLPAGVCP